MENLEIMDNRTNPEPPCRCTDGTVFTPYITKKGQRLYRKDGKMWAFPCTRCNKN